MSETRQNISSRLKVKYYGGIPARYRPGTTDEKILRGMLETGSSYKKISLGFDVEPGETWLDLGANIGAFAIYVKLKQAEAVCYEPEKLCFAILKRNVPWFAKFNSAVTSLQSKELDFFISTRSLNHYRGTIVRGKAVKPVDYRSVKNTFIGNINLKFDGVKMDIEGSEFGILDSELLPDCKKLVMEYHSSIDDCPKNLKNRLEYLRSKFSIVDYPPEYDKKIREGKSVKCFQDRNIFCMEPLP